MSSTEDEAPGGLGSTPPRALEGLLVLDLTTALAGPYATMLLAGLGARVVKIENPRTGGDPARHNSPYLGEAGASVRRRSPADASVSHLARGRNKESVCLDLKTDSGRRLLLQLCEQADVLVENYSAGVTSRLGIDPDRVAAVNPRLVYASISGFGAGGGDDRAMDTIIQALSGVMMTAGEPGGPPVRFGLPIADLAAPLFAVIGTLAALQQRERTGAGQHVDVSMLGALTSLVAAEPYETLEHLGLPTRTGHTVPRLAPFGTFPCSDGWIALCAPLDKFADGVLRATGDRAAAQDPRFADRDARVAHADALHGVISTWSATRPTADALAVLAREGVPCAPVRDPADAARDVRVRERGEVVALASFDGLDVIAPGVPVRLSGAATSLDRDAPELGEHTDGVLEELLGLGSDDLEQLRARGVV